MLHLNPSFVHYLSVSLLPLWTLPPNLGKNERIYWEFQWLPYNTTGPLVSPVTPFLCVGCPLISGWDSQHRLWSINLKKHIARQFFLIFTHVFSEPLLKQGFQEPMAGCVCSRSSSLEFALIVTLLILIWSSPEAAAGSSSPRCSGSITLSRLRNSWQFFWVERLSLYVSDMKSAYMFGRVTACYNHMASLECP